MTPPIESRRPSGTHVPNEAPNRDNPGTENPSPGESPATAPSPDQLRAFGKKASSGNVQRHPLFPAVNTATASRAALNRKQAMDSLGRLSQSTRSILDELAGQNPPNRDAKKLLKDWSAVLKETDPEKRFQKLQAWMSRAHGLIVDTKSADSDYRAALANYQSAQRLCIKDALSSGRVKNFWGEKIFLGAPEAHEVELVRRSGRVGILEWTRSGAPTFRSADGQVVVKWAGGTSNAYLNGRLTRREYFAQDGKTSFYEQGSFVDGKLVNGSTGVQGEMKNGVGVVKVSNVFTGLDEESDRQVKREEFLQPDGSTIGEVYKYLDNGEVNVMRYAPDGRLWRTDFESSTLETGQIWAEINKKGGPDYAKIGKIKHEIVWVGGKAVKRAAVLDASGNVLLWRVSRHDDIGAAVETSPSSKTPISVPLDGLASIKDSEKRLEKAREIASAVNKARGLVVDETQKALEESLVKYLAQCAEFTNIEEGQSLSLDLTYLDKGAAAGQPVFVMRRTDKDGSFVTQIAVVSSVVSKGERGHALAIRHPVYYDKDGKALEKQPEGAGQFVKKWYGADGKEYHLEKFETQFDCLGNTYRLSGTNLIGTGTGPENVTVETVASKTEQIGPGIIDRASRAYMDSLRAQGFAGEVQAAFLGGAFEFIGDVGHAAAYVGGTAYHTGKSLLLTDASERLKLISPDLAAEYDFGAEAEIQKAPLVRSFVNWWYGDQADANRMAKLRGSEKTTLERQLASQRTKAVDAQAFRMDSLAQMEAYDRARTPVFENEAARNKALIGVLDGTGTTEELIDWGFEKGREGQEGLKWTAISLGVVDTLGKTSAETLPFVGAVGAFGKGVQWLGRAEQASQTLMGLARAGNGVSQTTHWLMQGDLVTGMARNLENVSVAAVEGDPTKVIIAGTQAAVTGVFVAGAAKGHAKQRAQARSRSRVQETSKGAAKPPFDPYKVLGLDPKTPLTLDAVEAAYNNCRKQYRKAQFKNHPDRLAGEYHKQNKGPVPKSVIKAADARFMEAQNKFNEAQKAYEALKAKLYHADAPEEAARTEARKAEAPAPRPEAAPQAPEAPRALPAAEAPATTKVPKARPQPQAEAAPHHASAPKPGLSNIDGVQPLGVPRPKAPARPWVPAGAAMATGAVPLFATLVESGVPTGVAALIAGATILPIMAVNWFRPAAQTQHTPAAETGSKPISPEAQQFIEQATNGPDKTLVGEPVTENGVVRFIVRYNKGAGYFGDVPFYYIPGKGGGQMYVAAASAPPAEPAKPPSTQAPGTIDRKATPFENSGRQPATPFEPQSQGIPLVRKAAEPRTNQMRSKIPDTEPAVPSGDAEHFPELKDKFSDKLNEVWKMHNELRKWLGRNEENRYRAGLDERNDIDKDDLKNLKKLIENDFELIEQIDEVIDLTDPNTFTKDNLDALDILHNMLGLYLERARELITPPAAAAQPAQTANAKPWSPENTLVSAQHSPGPKPTVPPKAPETQPPGTIDMNPIPFKNGGKPSAKADPEATKPNRKPVADEVTNVGRKPLADEVTNAGRKLSAPVEPAIDPAEFLAAQLRRQEASGSDQSNDTHAVQLQYVAFFLYYHNNPARRKTLEALSKRQDELGRQARNFSDNLEILHEAEAEFNKLATENAKQKDPARTEKMQEIWESKILPLARPAPNAPKGSDDWRYGGGALVQSEYGRFETAYADRQKLIHGELHGLYSVLNILEAQSIASAQEKGKGPDMGYKVVYERPEDIAHVNIDQTDLGNSFKQLSARELLEIEVSVQDAGTAKRVLEALQKAGYKVKASDGRYTVEIPYTRTVDGVEAHGHHTVSLKVSIEEAHHRTRSSLSEHDLAEHGYELAWNNRNLWSDTHIPVLYNGKLLILKTASNLPEISGEFESFAAEVRTKVTDPVAKQRLLNMIEALHGIHESTQDAKARKQIKTALSESRTELEKSASVTKSLPYLWMTLGKALAATGARAPGTVTLSNEVSIEQNMPQTDYDYTRAKKWKYRAPTPAKAVNN